MRTGGIAAMWKSRVSKGATAHSATTLLAASVLWLGLGPPAELGAGIDRWTAKGPAGGSGKIIYQPGSSRVVYLVNGGIYRSDDGCAKWSRLATLPPETYSNALAIDPSDPDVLYANSWEYEGGLGLIKSTNRGRTWTYGNDGLTDPGVISLAVDPLMPQRVYAWTDENGLFLSNDAAFTWMPSNAGLPDDSYPPSIIRPDPSRQGTVYVVAGTKGVYKSVDNAETWRHVSKGLPRKWRDYWIHDIAIDPANSERLLAATGNGVYRTEDGANTWNQSGLAGQYCAALAISSRDPAIVYAAGQGDIEQPYDIYRSADGGTSWLPVPTGDLSTDVYHLAVDPNDPSTVIADSFGLGVLKTRDGGRDWFPSAAGLPGSSIYEIILDPKHAGILYAIPESSGAFKTMTNGRSWTIISDGMPRYGIGSFILDPGHTRTAYALGEGVQKTTDGGLSWSAANKGLGLHLSAQAIAMDPCDFDHLVTVTRHGFYETSDAARSWQLISTDLAEREVTELEYDPCQEGALHAFTRSGNRTSVAMYASNDGGKSWLQQGTGLPPDGWVSQLVHHPTLKNRLYIATYDGVYRSNDHGAHWVTLRNGWPYWQDAACVVFDPRDPETIYAATSGGVARWNERTKVWGLLNQGLDPQKSETSIQTLVFDPFHPDTLYAGTARGIFVRTLTR